LDFCLVCAGKILCYLQTPNTSKGIQDFIKRCKKQFGIKLKESLICMEHTGIYNYPLLDYLSGKQASIWLESALQIKHSSGLQRGKNDKIDAQRIAFYAYRNQDKIRLCRSADAPTCQAGDQRVENTHSITQQNN
jgi:transposase